YPRERSRPRDLSYAGRPFRPARRRALPAGSRRLRAWLSGCRRVCESLQRGRAGGQENRARLCCLAAALPRRNMGAHMRITLALLLFFSLNAWGEADRRLVEDLVAANRILAHEGVLAEGWGHVSVRLSKDRFLISQAVAPEMVQAADLVELDLAGNPVDGKARDLYSERFIHAEIYRVRPDVM